MMTTNAPAARNVCRIVGTVKRSRVRWTTAPRSRSCGRTSSTTNSRIIGTASRRLLPQSNDFGMSPVGLLNAIRVAKPSTIAPTNVQRQAAEPAEHRGRERVDDQQREQDRAQRSTLERRDQDAGQRGEADAEHPTDERRPVGPSAVQFEQRAVVDDRTHRDAGTGAVEEHAQPDRERDRDEHDRDVVPQQHGPEHVHLFVGAEERLDRVRVVRFPHPVRGRDQCEEHRDRDDELDDLGRVLDAADHDPVQQRAERGREHEQDEHEGQRRGPTPC